MQENKTLFKRLGIALLIIFAVFILFILIFNIRSSQEEDMPKELFLSDLDWESHSNSEAIDEEISADEQIFTLVNNSRHAVEFETGIGVFADTEIIYDLTNMDYNYLTTWVGVDHELSDIDSSLLFEIYADDVLKYESHAMNKRTPMEYTTIDISGAETLKLVVKNAGDKTEADYGNWVNPKLLVDNPIERNSKEIKDYQGMKLIFNEEFEGEALDSDIWSTRPWPENGSHHYANVMGEDENIWVDDGNLVLQAKPYEGTENYSTTSGHVVTHGNFDFRYGRIDVRAKIPTETGMWPAIWMMPAEQDNTWPMEGEIDIMELISQEPYQLYSTIHTGVAGSQYSNYYFTSGSTIRMDEGTFFDDYHIYSMEWEPGLMKFFVDDQLIVEVTDWQNWYLDQSDEVVERDFPQPFDQPFYIKLNLASGGWSKDIDETTRFGERTTMLVDYVRVYQEETPDYNYAEDEPFSNGKQGAVWYAQKDNAGTWENYQYYEADSKTWLSENPEENDEENDLSYVSLNRISANFDPNSSYNASAIAFRAPYSGFVKVALENEIELENDSEVTFNLTKGDKSTTKSDVLRSETITSETNDLSITETYLPIEADEMIRFEILRSDNEVANVNPIVEYISEDDYNDHIN